MIRLKKENCQKVDGTWCPWLIIIRTEFYAPNYMDIGKVYVYPDGESAKDQCYCNMLGVTLVKAEDNAFRHFACNQAEKYFFDEIKDEEILKIGKPIYRG